jgi:hypothetical protein
MSRVRQLSGSGSQVLLPQRIGRTRGIRGTGMVTSTAVPPEDRIRKAMVRAKYRSGTSTQNYRHDWCTVHEIDPPRKEGHPLAGPISMRCGGR